MEGLERVIREHPFFKDVDLKFVALVVGCAKNVRFEAGEYLSREGGPTNQFYLLRHGRVGLEMAVPSGGAVIFQTLGAGEVLGLNWFVPPYRWMYDARAIELIRAISLDAVCLRGKLDQDHDLAYEMMRRFVPVLLERMHGLLLQTLDVYGKPGARRAARQ